MQPKGKAKHKELDKILDWVRRNSKKRILKTFQTSPRTRMKVLRRSTTDSSSAAQLY
jgi:hypothetical protein